MRGASLTQYRPISRRRHCPPDQARQASGAEVSSAVELPSTFSTPLSILDLAPIVEGGTVSAALRNSLDLAQHAERSGYNRFWLAEHHNATGIASAATSVVIAHVAGGTSTIRVGAGGIMLPNHAPLVIAEQFGTLAALHPGPHRPRPRPCARHRPADDARAAPRPSRAPTPSRRMSSSCTRSSPTRSRDRRCAQSRAWARTCRSGSSARASTARSSQLRSVCRTRSHRTSRRTRSCPRSKSTATRSGRRSSCRSRMRWSRRT